MNGLEEGEVPVKEADLEELRQIIHKEHRVPFFVCDDKACVCLSKIIHGY